MKNVNDFIKDHFPGLENETWYPVIVSIAEGFADYINNWIEMPKMPDFDGAYQCHIIRNNECGTVSNYQEVVQCFCNNWIAKDRETITHWKRLMSNPELSAVV